MDHPADLRILPIDDAAQIAHIGGLHVSGLNGKNDLPGFAVSLVFVVEVEAPVDAAIRAFLFQRVFR